MFVSGINIFPDGYNVASVMSSWENNPGFPLVTVVRDYAIARIYIDQVRVKKVELRTPSSYHTERK